MVSVLEDKQETLTRQFSKNILELRPGEMDEIKYHNTFDINTVPYHSVPDNISVIFNMIFKKKSYHDLLT